MILSFPDSPRNICSRPHTAYLIHRTGKHIMKLSFFPPVKAFSAVTFEFYQHRGLTCIVSSGEKKTPAWTESWNISQLAVWSDKNYSVAVWRQLLMPGCYDFQHGLEKTSHGHGTDRSVWGLGARCPIVNEGLTAKNTMTGIWGHRIHCVCVRLTLWFAVSSH